jgi:hypothetical protein
MLCAAAPLTSPGAKLWYAAAPTTADGRFEIAVGGESVAILCEGDANLTHAACAGAGATVELWTIHKASRGGPSVGATFTGEPLAARVERIEDGSRAQRMGLRASDLLVQVGDQDLEGIGAETAIELWLQQVERVELRVLRDRKLAMLRPLP